MDELLLENSLFTNQSEYDDIIKDKEKVADIFFINYFGFFSLFKLGLRGDIKRYKSEEASLYPKYIGADNKDVSLSVKMLFDAKMTHGSVTARMTKLLAKVKGNMLEPKDIDNLALKEILYDSKITTANKPSIKVRQIMQQWIDDEFAIEWLAYYIYKIARLPEYKDITKEFVSMYKTGQYAQAYTNILNGSRKKHTGAIPKEFQNNNPTQLANTPTDNAVDALSDKEKFLAVFKQAIEAEKNKIVQGVGDVPVKNNSDYTEDKLPEPKQEPPAPPPVETVELGLVELTKETIKVNNVGDIEFIKPTNKNFVFNGEEIDSHVGFGYIETIIDLVTDGFRNAGVTPFVPNFDNIIYKFEIAVYAMFKEYGIKLHNREAVSLPRSIIIRNLIRDRVIGQTGDYLYPKEYDSYRSHVLSSVDAKDVSKKYIYQISTAKYGLKVIERVLSGELELDHDLLRGTFHILCGLASDDSIAYSSDSNTTLKSILNRFLNNGEQELTDDEITEQLVGMIVRGLFDKVTNIQKIDQIGLLELMQEIGMYDTVIDQDTGITHYVLNTDFYTIFSKLDDVKKYLDVGYVEIDNLSHFHLLRKTIPQPTMITNPFIDAIVGDNGITDSGYKFAQEFNELAQNNWITTSTPNGIDDSEYTHNNIQGLYLKIKEKSIGHLDQIMSHFRSFNHSLHKPTMSFLKTMNDKAQAIYSIETMLAMEHYSLDFDTRFAPTYSDLSSSNLDSMVCLALICSHFYTNGKFPKHPFYDDFIKKLGERLASYISKQMYDEFEAVAKDYNPYRFDNGSTLNHRTVKVLLGELTKYFPDINDKVKEVFFTNKQDIQKFIGVTTYTIPRIKSDEKDENGIYALTISDDIYQIAVEQVLSGEISLVDVHENISIKMLKDGKLTKEMTDQYMKELYARLQSYNPYSDHGHHDKFRGESMELLGMMVQTGVDFDQTLFNEIINLYSSEFMMNSDKYIDSMNGTSPSNNVPFVRMMLDPTLNVAVNENTDKIAELIFESILRRFSIGRGDTSVWELATVALMRIKDKDLYDRCENLLQLLCNVDVKKTHFEYKEDRLGDVFNPEIFAKMNDEAQKSIVNIMCTEINRKRKSNWMDEHGVPLYIDQLMSCLLAYGKVNGDDQIKNLITNARLKTLMANSITHQIDFDAMQLDLNNGIINTPKKLSKKLLLNLAKLNGFLNMADIKKEITIPRGTKVVDLVRHIKGEIKIIDTINLKLKDVPYDEVEHTEESLKRVNAKMWKTRTDKHKDYMLIFEKEFRPKERTDNVTEFLKNHPDSRVLELAFHGTGRIAGAYICRYGFADVRGDVGIGIAGKMLGNGTYVAINYDKSASYVTDRGTTYTAGKHNGYLFTLRCAIGKRGVHHQYAPAGGGLRVEEWCLKYPTQQIDVLSIFKCHSVTKKEAHDILGGYAK